MILFSRFDQIPNPKTQTGKEAQNSGPERELATHEATEVIVSGVMKGQFKDLVIPLIYE